MKIMKPLPITQIRENCYEYSNGYDKVTVEINQAKTADRYDGRKVFTLTWPSGLHPDFTLTDGELYGMLERRLLYPNSERYSLAEFNRACDKDGYLRGIVQLSADNISYSFEGTLIRTLIDCENEDIRFKKVKSYEIVGCEEHTIIVIVTIERYIEP